MGGGWHPLVDGCPPGWANAWGEDEYGVFVAFRVGRVVQRMRWIRPGEFWMGSPEGEEGRFEDEGPRHRVRLTRGFWLGETPVTQALWEAVMGENPSRFQGDVQRPVEQVSWEDCQRFCARLGERSIGPAFRLPTEAEWEFVCRAGMEEATYAERLGASLAEVAWWGENSGDSTHAVRRKLANQWGLHDMLGNVLEWCSDWSGSYSSAVQRDPAGPAVGRFRVFRGGSWGDDAGGVRAAYRGAGRPDVRDSDLGLRLARDQAQ